MFCTAEPIPAERALRIGIINDLIPAAAQRVYKLRDVIATRSLAKAPGGARLATRPDGNARSAPATCGSHQGSPRRADGRAETLPFLQLRPTPPVRDVAHRDGDRREPTAGAAGHGRPAARIMVSSVSASGSCTCGGEARYTAAVACGRNGASWARAADAIGCGHHRSSWSANRSFICGMTRSANSLVL